MLFFPRIYLPRQILYRLSPPRTKAAMARHTYSGGRQATIWRSTRSLGPSSSLMDAASSEGGGPTGLEDNRPEVLAPRAEVLLSALALLSEGSSFPGTAMRREEKGEEGAHEEEGARGVLHRWPDGLRALLRT